MHEYIFIIKYQKPVENSEQRRKTASIWSILFASLYTTAEIVKHISWVSISRPDICQKNNYTSNILTVLMIQRNFLRVQPTGPYDLTGLKILQGTGGIKHPCKS